MRMYVPEISDVITLSEDWKFDLYPESRNETLYNLLGHRTFWSYKTHDQVFVKNDSECIRLENELEAAAKAWRDALPKNGPERWTLNDAWTAKNSNLVAYYRKLVDDGKVFETVEVTIPASVRLKIDRIYIRKGISEYSSLTFTIPKEDVELIYDHYSIPKPKKITKGLRFWAKLSDVNKIHFS